MLWSITFQTHLLVARGWETTTAVWSEGALEQHSDGGLDSPPELENSFAESSVMERVTVLGVELAGVWVDMMGKPTGGERAMTWVNSLAEERVPKLAMARVGESEEV